MAFNFQDMTTKEFYSQVRISYTDEEPRTVTSVKVLTPSAESEEGEWVELEDSKAVEAISKRFLKRIIDSTSSTIIE